MSRIGNKPIDLPEGIEVKIDGSLVTVKGKKGELSQQLKEGITAEVKDNQIVVARPTDQKRHRAMHGLYRSLINNMVLGVKDGVKVELELVGVGFKCSSQGQLLEMALGYSHPVVFMIPNEIKLVTEMTKGKTPRIILESIDKQLIGQVAAKLRATRKVEPYKGKGVRFVGEVIRRKEGKTAAK
jgi:large subunit ribosomal protein L6